MPLHPVSSPGTDSLSGLGLAGTSENVRVTPGEGLCLSGGLNILFVTK